MLVLSILAMTAHRTPTHAVVIDLPFPASEPDTRLGLAVDLLRIDENGAVFWNSQAVSTGDLQRILTARQSDPNVYGLRFSPDADARYDTVLRVLAEVKATGNAEGGFCFDGHQQHRYFRAGSDGDMPNHPRNVWPCDPRNDGRSLPPVSTASAYR